MRKLLCFAFVFLSAFAFGQTTAVVSGHLVDQSETGTSSGISVDVILQNTGAQRCYIAGTGTVVTEKKNYTAAQILAGITLAKTANITCGTSTGNTRWLFTFRNSQLNTTRDCALQITGTTNLDNAACLNATSTPVTVTPTDSVYCRLDGTNCGFTGNITGVGAAFSEIVNGFYFCPIIDNTGLTDISATAQSCFNTAFTNGETLRFGKGKFLFNTAQNWTNKPGFKVEGTSSQFQLASQSPTAGAGETIFLGNTAGVLLDTTGSGDHTIKNLLIYLAGTGIATPSTVGILQGRDNAAGGGNGAFCFAGKFQYDNINIVDFTNNTAANGSRGYIGIYNVGAENGIYRNLGIYSGTPIVLASTNVASITSPFQTLATGCPASMTEVHLDSVVTNSLSSISSATPNIEASGTAHIWLTNHEFIGGNAAIKFAGTNQDWDVTGAQESTIATSYFIRATGNLSDSRFHVEATPATAMLNPEANSLSYSNNSFDFNADSFANVPFITNTATGTSVTGGRAVISGTTSATNTTVTGTDILAPGVTDANITFNAASNYEYKGTSGLISHGSRKFASGTLAAPGMAFSASPSTGWFFNSNSIVQLSYGNTAGPEYTASGDFFGSGMVHSWTSSVDPNNAAADTGLSRDAAGTVDVGNGTAGNTSGRIKVAAVVAGGTAATLTGTGACATFSTQTGGSMAGRATCTAGTAASTLTITPGTTAPNGWVCSAYDQTTRANLLQQTATVAASCTLTATSVTQNDVIVFTAIAF